MFASPPPRYIINPLALKEAVWLPGGLWAITNKYKNPNRLNSLWLGTAWNLFHTPVDVLTIATRALFDLRIVDFLVTLGNGPLALVQIMVSGIRGELLGLDLPREIMEDGIVLVPEHAAVLPEDYANLLVIDTDAIG